MQSRYEEIVRLGESAYPKLDIARDLDALIRLCSDENDQMLEQVDQIQDAAKNIVDSIYSSVSNIVGVFRNNNQELELVKQMQDAAKNIVDPVNMAISNIIGFLEEYEQAMGQEDGEEVYEEEGSEE